MNRTVLRSIILLIAGMLCAVLIGLLSARLLPTGHPLLRILGIQKPQIIGFLPYWLLDKTSDGYERSLTTLTYFGLAVDTDGKPLYLENPGEEDPGWTALKGEAFSEHSKKAKDAGLTLSLLVHSANEDSIRELVADPVLHAKALMAEVAPIMQKRGFTDLNLDIESFLPASESARANFTTFVRTVREEIDARKLGTLTVEVAPIVLARPMLIDPIAIGTLADNIVLMAYDYHYIGSFTAGAVAPIGGAGESIEFDVETSVQAAVRSIPEGKLILGIPLYGYQWETIEETPNAATIPGGASTASSRRAISLQSSCATCSASRDPQAQEPRLIYRENGIVNQLYYVDQEAIAQKINLAEKYRLGGVALWALGYEDPSLFTPLLPYKGRWRLVP